MSSLADAMKDEQTELPSDLTGDPNGLFAILAISLDLLHRGDPTDQVSALRIGTVALTALNKWVALASEEIDSGPKH